MPKDDGGWVGAPTYLRCPKCKSQDTHYHYEKYHAVCNSCGYVFKFSKGADGGYEDET